MKNISETKNAALNVNKGLTWEALSRMMKMQTPAKMKENVAIYVPSMNEYFPVAAVNFADLSNDALEKGRMYLVANDTVIEGKKPDGEISAKKAI